MAGAENLYQWRGLSQEAWVDVVAPQYGLSTEQVRRRWIPPVGDQPIAVEVAAPAYVKTGTGVQGESASGTAELVFAETGRSIQPDSANGTADLAYQETGKAVSDRSARGSKTVTAGGITYTDTGRGISGRAAKGDAAVAYAPKTGRVIAPHLALASDVLVYVEGGRPILPHVGSGARAAGGGVTYTKVGLAVIGP